MASGLVRKILENSRCRPTNTIVAMPLIILIVWYLELSSILLTKLRVVHVLTKLLIDKNH